MTDYAEQIRVEQVAALDVIRRVAESLPGFTFVENRSRINETAPMLVASNAASDHRPDLTRSDSCA